MTATPASSPDPSLDLLIRTGALKRGHFQLSSGLHSDVYCQCAKLFEDPAAGNEMAQRLAQALPASARPQTVLAPALGGILWGYDAARALGARSLFAERQPGGPFQLRRGFSLSQGERVLLAEDVVTTGGSVLELVPLVEAAGAVIVGFAAVVDRSGGRFQPAQPFFALHKVTAVTWKPEECPLCAQGTPIDKPGSRASAKSA